MTTLRDFVRHFLVQRCYRFTGRSWSWTVSLQIFGCVLFGLSEIPSTLIPLVQLFRTCQYISDKTCFIVFCSCSMKGLLLFQHPSFSVSWETLSASIVILLNFIAKKPTLWKAIWNTVFVDHHCIEMYSDDIIRFHWIETTFNFDFEVTWPSTDIFNSILCSGNDCCCKRTLFHVHSDESHNSLKFYCFTS